MPEDVVNPTIKITSKVNQISMMSQAASTIFISIGVCPKPCLFFSLESATVVEKDASSDVVYQAATTDRSGVQYSLEGADPNVFSIDPITGSVRL